MSNNKKILDNIVSRTKIYLIIILILLIVICIGIIISLIIKNQQIEKNNPLQLIRLSLLLLDMRLSL